MIFVNDLWTIRDVPQWLGHVSSGVDGMGLADVVFPMFLFIVGLSIPFALERRLALQGTNLFLIVSHVFFRSFALICMGVYQVNLEHYNSELALLPKAVWQIAIIISFFLLWLDFSRINNARFERVCQSLGVVGLLVLAGLYRGGTPQDPQWMQFHWWGILGLIGWGYLVAALLYLLGNGDIRYLFLMFLSLFVFNAADASGWLDAFSFIRPYFWIIDNGATPVLCMAGVLVSMLIKNYYMRGSHVSFWTTSLGFAVVSLMFGFLSRPLWGIHKIGASPSWVAICLGISILTLMGVIWLVDIKKKQHWFSYIKPAGTSTLTCYLLPYIHYGLLALSGIALPLMFRTGEVGLIKCAVYAFVIITLTGFLEKVNLRLRV